MKIKSLTNALRANGLLHKLKNVVSGSERLSESQLKNVAAGTGDDINCAIYIGPPCGIAIGPINNSIQDSGDQTGQ